MSGIMNSTGAVSGIIGTTVGTPSTAPIAGQMRHLANTSTANITDVLVSTNLHSPLLTGTFTAGSRILLHAYGGLNVNGVTGYGQGYFAGISASTGTPTDSGLGATTSGHQVVQEFGHQMTQGSRFGYSVTLIVTPLNGATSAGYNFYFLESSGSQSYHFYKTQFHLYEVYS